jgi:hypothetical protein
MPAEATTEGSIVAYLRLNDSDWNATLDRAEAKARELATIDPTVRVQADTSTALAKLDEVRLAEERVGGTTTSRVNTVVSETRKTSYDSDAALQAAQQQVLVAAYAEADAAIQKLKDDQEAENASMREASVQALKESIMMQALDAAERNAAEGAEKNAAAQEASAAATNSAGQAAQNGAGYTGLIVAAIAAAIPLAGALTGAAFGLAGGLTLMGGAGVLAILGIKDEMTQATSEGLQYSAGLAQAKTMLTQLSDAAATSMLPAFGSALRTVSDAMPWLNEQMSVFASTLGVGANMALEGVLNLFHQANPLFVQGAQFINQIAAGFLRWTQDGGLTSFIAYAEQQLPIVMSTLGNLVQMVTNVITAFAPIGTVVLSALDGLSWAISNIPTGDLLLLSTFALTAFGAFKAWGALQPVINDISMSLRGVGVSADAALGPIGLVVLGVTGLVTAFSLISGAQTRATQAANDWAQALEADNYQIGQQSQAMLAKNLHDSGQLQMAHQLGISTETYTKAVLGNKEALGQVNDKMSLATKSANTMKDGQLSGTDAQKKNAIAADALKKALDGQMGSMAEGAKISQAYKDALNAANGATGTAVSMAQQVADAQTKAAAATDKFAQALQGLGNTNLSATAAAIAYTQAIADSDTALQKNGATLDINTQKGRDNMTALDNIASSAIATMAAQAKAGASTQALTGDMVSARAQFIATAEKMGATADEANHLADQYGLIPKNVTTNAQLTGVTQAEAEAARLSADLAAIAKDWTIPVHIVTTGTMPTAGKLVAQAGGGPVTQYKAGGGAIDSLSSLMRPVGTDTVPTMLTPDEFVVKRSSAAFNPQFMKAYNDNPAGALAAYGGGGNITVTVVNKTGMTLSDLIDIQVQRSQRQMSSKLGADKQKGAY